MASLRPSPTRAIYSESSSHLVSVQSLDSRIATTAAARGFERAVWHRISLDLRISFETTFWAEDCPLKGGPASMQIAVSTDNVQRASGQAANQHGGPKRRSDAWQGEYQFPLAGGEIWGFD